MQDLASSLKYAGRMLSKWPLLTVAVLLILGLGVGVNVALFAIVDSVLLQELPFDQPQQLARIWESNPEENRQFEDATPANYLEWKRLSRTFQSMAFWMETSLTLEDPQKPEEVSASEVSIDFFSLLGVPAHAGRTFSAEEGRQKVAVISYGLASSRYGNPNQALGSSLNLEGEQYEIIGVMPPGFAVPEESRIWVPRTFRPGDFPTRHYLKVLGRLADGVSLEQASQELAGIADQLENEYPDTNSGWTVLAVPLHEQVVGAVRGFLLFLFGAVVVVLMIACANIASLLLARSERRQEEMAVRRALGATRWDLIRQMLVESVLLGLAAGAAGLAFAFLALRFLPLLEPGELPRMTEIAIDPDTLLFALGISTAAALIFGILPALKASRPSQVQAVRSDSGTAISSGTLWGMNLLSIGQIGLTFVLLIAAGLLIRSFNSVLAVQPGFDIDNILVARISLDDRRYPENPQKIAYFNQLLEQLRSLPGVESSGAVTALPLSPGGIHFDTAVSTEGNPEPFRADFRVVTPDYFESLGIPVLQGRPISDADGGESPRIVVVNQTLSRQVWPGEDPVGKKLRFFGPRFYQVVGVVGNSRYYGLDAAPKAEIFVAQTQMPSFSAFHVVIRTQSSPSALAGTVWQAALRVDPIQPFSSVTSMRELLSDSVARRRFMALLCSVMAGLAVLVAVIGVYSMVSYSVARRTHEIGIRLALGAKPRTVLATTILRNAGMAAGGIVLGTVAALYFSEAIQSFVFQITVHDPATYLTMSALLMGIVLAGCYLPIRRAASIDPASALRYE